MSLLLPFFDATAKLSQSKLSDQLEALDDEIDLNSLNLLVSSLNEGESQKVQTSIRNSIVAGTISRTIQGASVLELKVADPELALLNSGIFGFSTTLIQNTGSLLTLNPQFVVSIDCEINGLYFRCVSVDNNNRILTLQFEDREVNVLRSYPREGDPKEYVAFRGMDRIRAMQWLIQEAKEFGPQGPRISSPILRQELTASASGQLLEAFDATARAVTHQPGFPLQGSVDVTVKGAPASPAQLNTISEVLEVGHQMNLNATLLQVAVMVVTQESDAGTDTPTPTVKDPSVGAFQQIPKDVPTGATGDVKTDALAFYNALVPFYNAHPGLTPALLAANVQRPKTFINGQDPTGQAYGQWAMEAAHTVSVWSGTSEDIPIPTNPLGITDQRDRATGAVISSTLLTRGSQSSEGGRPVVTREDNWSCLQKFGQQVGWLVYCVSGTIYIEDWAAILSQAVRMQISEETPGIDSIAFEIDTGMANATATVQCRISRWGAPPGSVVQINGMGPASGRWVVQTIDRDLFTTVGTITLQKPQGSISRAAAELASPVLGVQILTASGSTAAATKAIARDVGNVRAAIVAAAQAAFARGWPAIQYSQGFTRSTETSLARPVPPTIYADCSSFVTLCYKAAGAPDPNDQGYQQLGNTGTLIAKGIKTNTPQPGDLLFYGDPTFPNHVQLWIGDDTVIQMGRTGAAVQRETVSLAKFLAGKLSDGEAGSAIGFYTYNLGPLG